MIRWSGLPLLAAIASVPAMAAPGPVAWAPAGKWTIDYADRQCVASRTLVASDRRLTVGIAPPPANNIAILLIAADAGAPQIEEARVYVERVPVEARSLTYLGSAPDKKRVYQVALTSAEYAQLLSTGTLQITNSSLTANLQLSGLPKVREQLDHCNVDLLKRWGFPAALQQIGRTGTPLKGTARGLVTAADFPSDAAAAGASGSVHFLLTVGANGRSTSCRILQSAGHPSLDKRTSQLAMNRARFEPARDSSGKSVEAPWIGRITWVVEN